MQQQHEPHSMEHPPAWEERWEQCWPLLLGHLSARDFLCLCLSSRSIMSRLDSTPGCWQQACQDCLCWPPQLPSTTASTTQPPSRTINPTQTPAAATDQQARHVLFAATALAHQIKHARSPPPATVQIPPWLPGQPGITRGFHKVDPASLDPPLSLTPTQLSWLAYGSLSGHTSGVFISTCSSSPRSHQPCAFLAAVISHKTLGAELYSPRNTTPPDPWTGILSLPCQHTDHSSSSSSSAVNRPGCVAAGDSSSSGCGGGGASSSGECSAIGMPRLELWLSNSVQLHQQQQARVTAGGGRAGGRNNRGRRARHAAGSGSDGSRGDCWADIHKLIVDCVADNASRCKAVRGSTVIPPGTPAAAAIEQHLAQLAAAGGPVLDLRRLDWEAAAVAGRQQAAAAQQRQHQGQLRWPRDWMGMQTYALQTTHSMGSGPKQQQQQQQQHQQQQQQQGGMTDQVQGCWGWQAAASAAVQSALAAVYAAATAAGDGQVGGPAADAADGDKGELLAALVERLSDVVPDIQVLVLPVLLPGGRAAQRVPSIGGSRMSAPKLLCLNVPFLMAVRKHAWERLPHLRHVLLMAGTPLPLPQVAATKQAFPYHQQQQVQGPQQPQQQQQHASHEGKLNGVGGFSQVEQGQSVVQGTFTLQQLEQLWQQQLQVGQEAPLDHSQLQQQQQGQYLWEVEQQDQWFEQQVAQQKPWQQQQNGLSSSSNGSFCVNGCEDAGCDGARGSQAVRTGVAGVEQEPVLSRAAVDALHDMVLSCMDRSC